MSIAKRTLVTAAFSALMGASALLMTAGSASAYVACNAEGDCWHTDKRVSAPGVTFTYHPDDWYFHQRWDGDRHFRDYHEGRGYYRGGVWINL